jgi:hypothetical protein
MRVFIWRLFKKGLVVQVALTVLLASAVALLAIYNSYIARETRNMNGRIVNQNPQGFYLVTDAGTQRNFDPPGGTLARPYELVASWYHEVTPSNFGNLPINYIELTYGYLALAPEPNVAAMHDNVARRLGISVGDEIVLSRKGRTAAVRVVDIYDSTPFNFGVDFGEGILVRTGEPQDNKHFLYKQHAWGRDAQIRSSLAAIHTRGSVIKLLNEDDPMGELMVRANYNVVTQAKVTLLLFLTLAFLTAKFLSYMDTRRVLAILKALGLRSNQVSGTILGEAFISPVFGSLLGGLLAVFILRALNSAGHNMPMSPASVLMAMVAVFPAVALGAIVPARLAQVSTVNELLYERPSAIIREKVDRLARYYPAFEAMSKRGVHLIRLNVYEGVFDGFIFRKLGDRVQAGEVIALEQQWWGLKTREYISPVTGVIIYFEDTTGMIGIEPV